MTIGDFAVKVAEKEGGKKSLSIAQIKEVLRIVNTLVGGELYKIIKNRNKKGDKNANTR